MIQIKDKSNCCGCQACGDVCPKQAIAFKIDKEGFWYPGVDSHLCVDCGLCERVCPCLNDKDPKRPLTVFAAVNPDEEVRMESSSGGIFWMLVKHTIEEDGVVFGAAFDEEWMVCHSSADTLADARKYRGSKYVQSRLVGRYTEAQRALKQGRKVLFSGTACQIAGLKNYLNKDYPNLLTVDVVCHGVPSPGIWREYIKHLSSGRTINSVSFRDKQRGWSTYDFLLQYSDGKKLRESHFQNIFMQGYLHGFYLRPSCHSCRVKHGKCGSDITLGDFWGVENLIPELNDNKGTSVILVNTAKGKETIQGIDLLLREVEYEQAVSGNACIEISTKETEWRSVFMNKYLKGCGIDAVISTIKQIKPSLIKRVFGKLRRFIKRK